MIILRTCHFYVISWSDVPLQNNNKICIINFIFFFSSINGYIEDKGYVLQTQLSLLIDRLQGNLDLQSEYSLNNNIF